MTKRKTKPNQLKLVPYEVKQPKGEELDELALLIRSINESGRKAKAQTQACNEVEPEPPLAA